MLRHAGQRVAGLQILRVRVGVVDRRDQIIPEIHLRRELEALRARLADVRHAGEGKDVERDELDQVLEVGVEVGGPETDPVLPELLVHAHVPGHAPLGLEGGVGEVREEEVVDRRRAKARARAPPELRAPLLDHPGDRAPPRRRAAEDAVVLVAEPTADEEPVEEAELLLEEDGRGVGRLLEDALVVALLVPVLEAHRARAPVADEERVDPLRLVPGHVDPGADRALEGEPGIGRVLEVQPVRVPGEPPPALPPRHRAGLALEREHQGLALLLRVRVDDRDDRLGRREDGLDGQADVVLVVADDEGERALPGQRQPEARVERIDVRVVVLELAVALEVRAGERVVEELPGPTEGRAGGEGVVVPRLLLDRRGKRPLAFPRDDVDHAPDGVRSVQRGLGPADDLDALDLVRRDVGQIHLPGGRALHADAVHEDLDLVRVGAADAERAELAIAARLRHLESGHVADRLGQARVMVGLDVLTVDDGDRCPELLLRRLDLGRCHHHGLDSLRLLGLPGRRRRRQQGQENPDRVSHDPLL